MPAAVQALREASRCLGRSQDRDRNPTRSEAVRIRTQNCQQFLHAKEAAAADSALAALRYCDSALSKATNSPQSLEGVLIADVLALKYGARKEFPETNCEALAEASTQRLLKAPSCAAELLAVSDPHAAGLVLDEMAQHGLDPSSILQSDARPLTPQQVCSCLARLPPLCSKHDCKAHIRMLIALQKHTIHKKTPLVPVLQLC